MERTLSKSRSFVRKEQGMNNSDERMEFCSEVISNARDAVNALTSIEPDAKAATKFSQALMGEKPGEDDWIAIFLASRSFSYCLL